MSNANTVNGFYNLPTQVITVNTEIALLVPAQGAYAGLPSPTLPASAGLTASLSPDIVGVGSTLDLHRFNVRIGGKFANPGGGNVTVKLYQVPLVGVGVISATGSVTSGGAPGSGDVAVTTFTALTTPANPSSFSYEVDLLWSAAVNRIDGWMAGIAAGTVLAPTVITAPVTSGVTLATALNFLPSFTFATANAGNSVTISEFVVERV
jgi:hypothetical protein